MLTIHFILSLCLEWGILIIPWCVWWLSKKHEIAIGILKEHVLPWNDLKTDNLRLHPILRPILVRTNYNNVRGKKSDIFQWHHLSRLSILSLISDITHIHRSRGSQWKWQFQRKRVWSSMATMFCVVTPGSRCGYWVYDECCVLLTHNTKWMVWYDTSR